MSAASVLPESPRLPSPHTETHLNPQAESVRSDTVLLRAAKLYSRPGVVLENTNILIVDGTIRQVGQDVTGPEGAQVIEGAVVCAGFIDPWSTLGLTQGAISDRATDDASLTTDGFDPYGSSWAREQALEAGVTAVRVQVGMTSGHGGVGAVMSTEPGEDVGELVVLADANVAVAIGLNSGGRAPDVFSRISAVDKLVSAIGKGKSYAIAQAGYVESLAAWNAELAEAEAKLAKDFKKAEKDRAKDLAKAKEDGKELKEKKYKESKRPKKPREDAEDAAMARVATGELPLVVTIHRAAELRALLKGTEQFKRLRLVIAGGSEAESVADQLAVRGIPVIVQPIAFGVNRPDELDGHDLSLAGRLADAGVRVLLGSGGAGAQDLPLLACQAIGHGLDRDKALAALTTEVARTFDLSTRLGAVRAGRRADLLVLDGEPLVPTTRVRYVLSNGRVLVSPRD